MLRILFVTPEPDTVAPLEALLEQNGMCCLIARDDSTLNDLNSVCGGLLPDLVIADMRCAIDALPLRALRRRLSQTWNEDPGNVPPMLTLLGTRQLATRDWLPLTEDILAPPHSPEELLARVRLLLFRRRQIENGDTIRFCDVILDLPSGIARHAGTGGTVPLTPREWDLLCFLLTHRGKLYSRERLLDFVWGVDYVGGARTVDIHIRRLRTKIPPQAASLLENRRGLGYGFTATVTD